MEFESNKKYSFYYHYMHYYPMCVVQLKCDGCLMERTLELLKQDPMVIIDDIKEIKEDK